MGWRPINLGGYRLGEDGLTVPGERVKSKKTGKTRIVKPNLAQAQEVGEFLLDFEEHSPFYIGAWWHDAKTRFGERAHQLVDGVRFKRNTLDEYERVHLAIPPKRRFLRQGLTFSHHQAVAALDETHQREVLAKAVVDGLSSGQVRKEARRIKRKPVSEGAARLRGRYRVLYADPDYSNMTLDELVALPVEAHMKTDAALFLWCPERLRFDVKRVLDAWGFEHRRAFIWNRVLHQGPDNYLSTIHEHLLWCVRGSCPPDQLTPMLDSVVTVRGSADDEKPDRFRELIERLYDHGPYLELLARRRMKREGWTFYGRQIGAKVA